MSEAKNNAFDADSPAVRNTRLNRIQRNYTEYASTLTITPELTAWAATCHDRYEESIRSSGFLKGSAAANTIYVENSFTKMKAEYVLARRFIATGKSNAALVEAYGFKGSYPIAQPKQMERVEQVLAQHAIRLAANDGTALPDEIAARLQIARDAIIAAKAERTSERNNKVTAVYDKKLIFREDTGFLKDLYRRCLVAWGDDDARLIKLGFRMRSQMKKVGRKKKKKPDAGENNKEENGAISG